MKLICSVPGYHKGNSLNSWGHLKAKSILNAETSFSPDLKNSSLVCQVISTSKKTFSTVKVDFSYSVFFSGFVERFLARGIFHFSLRRVYRGFRGKPWSGLRGQLSLADS